MGPVARTAASLLTVTGLAAAGLTAGGGCVEQELHVDTNPDGALVYMNDQEVGRTPIRRPFTWYGTYDVVVRKEGYETLRTKQAVIAPAWLWVPFDLVLHVLPIRFTDTQRLKFELKPENEATVDPDQIMRRAAGLQGQLESGVLTKDRPATRPATPATKPRGKAAKSPATGTAATAATTKPAAP
jgi:hypothetical protein